MEVPRPTPRVLLIGVVVALAALVVLVGWVFIGLPRVVPLLSGTKWGRMSVTPSPTATPASTPTPTPIPLAPGKQVYAMQTQSKANGPAIIEASFDPLDVRAGEPMVVSVKTKDASSVTITMIDDAGTRDYVLTSSSSGIWTDTIASQTTHTRIYGATIVAKNARGEERKVELWFR